MPISKGGLNTPDMLLYSMMLFFNNNTSVRLFLVGGELDPEMANIPKDPPPSVFPDLLPSIEYAILLDRD